MEGLPGVSPRVSHDYGGVPSRVGRDVSSSYHPQCPEGFPPFYPSFLPSSPSLATPSVGPRPFSTRAHTQRILRKTGAWPRSGESREKHVVTTRTGVQSLGSQTEEEETHPLYPELTPTTRHPHRGETGVGPRTNSRGPSTGVPNQGTEGGMSVEFPVVHPHPVPGTRNRPGVVPSWTRKGRPGNPFDEHVKER